MESSIRNSADISTSSTASVISTWFGAFSICYLFFYLEVSPEETVLPGTLSCRCQLAAFKDRPDQWLWHLTVKLTRQKGVLCHTAPKPTRTNEDALERQAGKIQKWRRFWGTLQGWREDTGGPGKWVELGCMIWISQRVNKEMFKKGSRPNVDALMIPDRVSLCSSGWPGTH